MPPSPSSSSPYAAVPDDAAATVGADGASHGGVMPWLAYGTVSIVWGSTYLAIAVALESFTTYGMVAVRFGAASLLTLTLGRLLREPLPALRELPHLFWVGTLLLGICNALVVWSEQHVSSGVAAVLCAMSPAFVGLLTMREEPLGARGWIGTGVGLTGVVILVAPSPGHSIDLRGVGAILVATFLWAVGTLHHRRHVHSKSVLTNAGLEMLAAAVIGLVVAPLTGGFVKGIPTHKAALAVAYLALFGSCLAYTAFGFLTKAWHPVRAGTFAYLNPVIAVFLGTLLIGERFDARMGLGMAVILGGVALVQYRATGD
jgi:drug/metabolite transporter (DMT)-like permease